MATLTNATSLTTITTTVATFQPEHGGLRSTQNQYRVATDGTMRLTWQSVLRLRLRLLLLLLGMVKLSGTMGRTRTRTGTPMIIVVGASALTTVLRVVVIGRVEEFARGVILHLIIILLHLILLIVIVICQGGGGGGGGCSSSVGFLRVHRCTSHRAEVTVLAAQSIHVVLDVIVHVLDVLDVVVCHEIAKWFAVVQMVVVRLLVVVLVV